MVFFAVLASCKPQPSEVPIARIEEARPEQSATARDVPVGETLPGGVLPSGKPESEKVAPRPEVLFDEVVTVGTHSSYVHCEGPSADTLPPLVVFEAGLGDSSLVWADVLPEVARFARACAYDRLGVGESSAAPLENSMPLMVTQLHAVLEQVGPKESLVLVGHSLGGLLARLYTKQYETEVAGLVLVDAASEDATEIWSLLPADARKKVRDGFDTGPEHLDFEALKAGMASVRGTGEAAEKQALGGRPLIVLSAAKPAPVQVSAEVDAKVLDLWLDLQAEMVRLSGNSVQFVTRESTHYLQVDEPDLVVLAVREVLHAAKTGQRVRSDFPESQLPLSPERGGRSEN